MPPTERAKQFLPFSALKGLQEALEKKEYDAEEQENRQAESTGRM